MGCLKDTTANAGGEELGETRVPDRQLRSLTASKSVLRDVLVLLALMTVYLVLTSTSIFETLGAATGSISGLLSALLITGLIGREMSFRIRVVLGFVAIYVGIFFIMVFDARLESPHFLLLFWRLKPLMAERPSFAVSSSTTVMGIGLSFQASREASQHFPTIGSER